MFSSLGITIVFEQTEGFTDFSRCWTRIPTSQRSFCVRLRSKPNSRTTFIGEQPNPSNLLQLEDVMSRHRGAKRPRRYEL